MKLIQLSDAANAVLAHRLTVSVIENAMHHLVESPVVVLDPKIRIILDQYASQVAETIFESSTTAPNLSQRGWLYILSTDVHRIFNQHSWQEKYLPATVQSLRAIDARWRIASDPWWRVAFYEILHTTGCVAYMVKYDQNPDVMTSMVQNASILYPA